MKIRILFYFEKADALFEIPDSELVITEEIQFAEAARIAVQCIKQCADEMEEELSNIHLVAVEKDWKSYEAMNIERDEKCSDNVKKRILELLIEKWEEENL